MLKQELEQETIKGTRTSEQLQPPNEGQQLHEVVHLWSGPAGSGWYSGTIHKY